MRKLLLVSVALIVGPGTAQAQNLLSNPSLESPFWGTINPNPKPGVLEADDNSPDDWTLVEGPDSLRSVCPDCPEVEISGDYNGNHKVDAADYVVWRKNDGTNNTLPNDPLGPPIDSDQYDQWRANFGNMDTVATNTAMLRDYANFSNPNGGANNLQELWVRPWMGNLDNTADQRPETVFAHLTQSVAGTPSLLYEFRGWSFFEANYSGGVDNLDGDRDEPPDMNGPPSPTVTEFAIEFLDGTGGMISDVVLDLRADGQINGGGWMEHVLMGVAPGGTVNVQVRASMIDGTFNVDPGQSLFLDDFSLTASVPGGGPAAAVPEPATWVLAAMGLLLVGVTRRGRK